jgi:glycosyltransferase involved in cell wall biosynthesis
VAERPQRLVFAYQPRGFTQTGGLRRIASTVAAHQSASQPQLALATLCHPAAGALPHTSACRRLRPGDQLLIVGCNSPWAYGMALWARLRRRPVSWMPSFHDPRSALHRRRARLAQLVLKAAQRLGVVVYVQTPHEATLLEAGPSHPCRLSGHGLPPSLRQRLLQPQSQWQCQSQTQTHRPIDLLFLGRPTAQKGWPLFLALAEASALRCEAIVPFPPPAAGAVTLHHLPSDATVAALLAQAKLVVIPANYESFGIAQLEALVAGCVVPILGHWPLWDGYPELHWQQLRADALAQRCQQLCRDPGQRQRLLESQLAYLRQHPVLDVPILPGLP